MFVKEHLHPIFNGPYHFTFPHGRPGGKITGSPADLFWIKQGMVIDIAFHPHVHYFKVDAVMPAEHIDGSTAP